MRDVYLVSTVRVSVSDDAPDRLEQVLAYMSQHCDDSTLVSVAAHFNVHPNTISGMIRRETGHTFSEIIRKMRLARATVLLRSGQVSVAQVAHLCGYENPSNLYRAFRQEYDCTPREYIQRLEAQEDQLRRERANKTAGKASTKDAKDIKGTKDIKRKKDAKDAKDATLDGDEAAADDHVYVKL